MQCIRQAPACKEGEESLGGKCAPKCPAGTVRAIDGLACAATKPFTKL